MTEHFGAWLKKELAEKNMTQVELAKSVGISKSSVTMYIKNNVHPKHDTFTKILHVLGYEVVYKSKADEL